jgi:hypothetical protein
MIASMVLLLLLGWRKWRAAREALARVTGRRTDSPDSRFRGRWKRSAEHDIIMAAGAWRLSARVEL